MIAMKTKNKTKSKKIDLLAISDSKRIELIKQVKETLREKAVEAKLWQSLLDLDDLTINGEKLCLGEKYSLTGLSLPS